MALRRCRAMSSAPSAFRSRHAQRRPRHQVWREPTRRALAICRLVHGRRTFRLRHAILGARRAACSSSRPAAGSGSGGIPRRWRGHAVCRRRRRLADPCACAGSAIRRCRRAFTHPCPGAGRWRGHAACPCIRPARRCCHAAVRPGPGTGLRWSAVGRSARPCTRLGRRQRRAAPGEEPPDDDDDEQDDDDPPPPHATHGVPAAACVAWTATGRDIVSCHGYLRNCDRHRAARPRPRCQVPVTTGPLTERIST
jgi:hypothetical protein